MIDDGIDRSYLFYTLICSQFEGIVWKVMLMLVVYMKLLDLKLDVLSLKSKMTLNVYVLLLAF